MKKIIRLFLICLVPLYLVSCEIDTPTGADEQGQSALSQSETEPDTSKAIMAERDVIGPINTCSEYTAANLVHLLSNRAYMKEIQFMGLVMQVYYAKGTNEFMGFGASTVTTLHKKFFALGWKVGPCPETYNETYNHTDDGYIYANYDDGSGAYAVINQLGPVVGNNMDGLDSRAIISFDTSSIPDDAVIKSVYVSLDYRLSNGSPWADNIMVIDVKNGAFGANAAIEEDDWGNQDGSDADAYSTAGSLVSEVPYFNSGTQNSTYFNTAGKSAINKTGTSQIRLRFLNKVIDPGAAYSHHIQMLGWNPDNLSLHVTYED
ncbi:MAG: hypothetical protein GY754_37495 [bacterium]|nr:hypothetical protein [bacterium]